MQKYLAAASAVALLAAAAPAMAQDLEGSVAYSSSDFDPATLGAVTGRLTWNATPIFAVEGEASLGVKDDTVTTGGITSDVELKHQLAVYGVAGVPVGESGRVFARVGYGTTKVKATVAGVSASNSEDSVNYGVGGQFFFDGANGLRADYTKQDFRNGGGDADVWSIGYVRKFR